MLAGHQAEQQLDVDETWTAVSSDDTQHKTVAGSNHMPLRDLLKNLCKRHGAAFYCDTANRFTAYLAARPG